MIITVDGPSGTGKTTVAIRVAKRLHFAHFDTGAMYRAVTWLILENNIDIADSAAVERVLGAFDFKVVESDGKKRYFVGASDVTEAIRSRAVTAFVSSVSALRQVRSALIGFQRDFALMRDAVFEGRDLGTVVFPQAELKIFLTADPKVRAERRLAEILAKNPQEARGLNHEQMVLDLMSRDHYDSHREIAPLRCPDDAALIDTTHLCIDAVVDQVVELFLQRFPDRAI